MTDSLPQELRRFILTSIPSVPFLEAVLLLRSDRARNWTAPQLAGRLYLPERQAAELLTGLTASGIAASSGDEGCHYQPSSPDLAGLLDALSREYSQNLVGVTALIHSRVEKRAQQFADAFRLRKDRDKENN